MNKNYKKPNKKRLPSLKTLDNKLWSLTSKWVRLSTADYKGNVKCYTCSTVKHWKEMQAGHYIKRAYKYIKFDLRNVKPQCAGCNLYKDGNQAVFAINLEREYGYGILQDLDKIKLEPFRRGEYMQAIADYEGYFAGFKPK